MLVGRALEQFEPVAAERRVAVWLAWFADAGIARRIRTASAPPYGLRMNSAAAVLQAAIDGQGIALARSIMAGMIWPLGV